MAISAKPNALMMMEAMPFVRFVMRKYYIKSVFPL
jgi:hypothetical protein